MYTVPNHISRLALLMQEELAASETYHHALVRSISPRQADALMLIQDDHVQAARRLREYTPPSEECAGATGGWIVLSHAVDGVVKLYGKMAALQSLQDGEELAIRDYEESLDADDVPQSCKLIIRSTLLPQATDHIRLLGTLIHGQQEASHLDVPGWVSL